MSKLDGKGLDSPKDSTPQDSVGVTVRTDVPGGESKGKKGIEVEGPNSYKKGKK